LGYGFTGGIIIHNVPFVIAKLCRPHQKIPIMFVKFSQVALLSVFVIKKKKKISFIVKVHSLYQIKLNTLLGYVLTGSLIIFLCN